MNNIHKVIFNKNTQQFVVVSELAKSAGKTKVVSADSLDIVSILQNFSEKHKRRGVTASAANGVASVGIGRSKSGTNEDTANTRLQLSRFNALGNLTFVAEDGDLTLNAAQLQSGNDMHVQGKNVYLNALTENESRHVSHYARSAGIGVNMVYNPKQVFKDNFGEQANQGSAVGIVGKIFTTAEAAGKTTNQVFTPGGVYGHSQRSRLEKEGTQSNAVVSTVDAGGNLSIIATQGDIHSQGAQFSAKGNGEFWAQENVNLDVAVSTSGQNSQEKRKGATAKANRINAEIKGDLTIESLQDIHQSESNSAGFGGRLQGAIGSAWGGSAYGNLASGEANRKQVTQQSGLFAEDGGYGINANNVDFRDIENYSSSHAVSAGVSASVNLNKATGTEAKQQAQTAKLTGTPQSNGISPSIPMFDSSEDRSITKATLTEGKITLNKQQSNQNHGTSAWY